MNYDYKKPPEVVKRAYEVLLYFYYWILNLQKIILFIKKKIDKKNEGIFLERTPLPEKIEPIDEKNKKK